MIKNLLIEWLFAEKNREYDAALTRVVNEVEDFKTKNQAAKDKFIASFDVSAYIMTKMKAFDPVLVQDRKVGINPRTGEKFVSGDIIEMAKKKGITEEVFLAEMSSIHKNTSFQFLIDYLQSSQILLTFFTATNAESMNFGRAHAGAHEQVRDEVGRLHGILEARNKKPEDFDEHSVV